MAEVEKLIEQVPKPKLNSPDTQGIKLTNDDLTKNAT